jgi:type IV pilus assembly protein PilC
MSTEALLLLAGGALAYAPAWLSAFLILIRRRAGWVGTFAAVLSTLYVVFAALILTGSGVFLFVASLSLPFCLLVYVYRRYRQGRQEEIFQILTTAVESNMPLGPALQAYLFDRPADGRIFWDAALVLLCPPGYPLWTQRRTFDDRVAHLSQLLAAGAPLPQALRLVRGVAPREVTVAADVGDSTGRLATCLRRVDRERLAGAWLEIAPRIIYPLLLFLFVTYLITFLGIYVVPKFKRIFDDFGMQLPYVTQIVLDGTIALGNHVDPEFLGVIFLGLLALLGLAGLLLFSRSVRWHLPFIGRLFRWEDQGLVLRMLGLLFEAGRPTTEAIGLLTDAPDVPRILRRRLRRSGEMIHRGQSLAVALHGSGLLPTAMGPMVSAAERAHTLPFALTELGELLAGRSVRYARRASYILAPLLVLGIGLLVLTIALGVLMPLIMILTNLAT